MSDRILVVNQEPETSDLIELYLKNENYDVCKCQSASGALQAIDACTFDLAILDVMLPGSDGLFICRHIREKHTYPIIMVTAKDSETDKITGLAMGADDYITKPFRPLELVARVKAQLRRYKQYNLNVSKEQPSILTYKDLLLNTKQHSCSVADIPIDLTPTEFSILEMLLLNKGKVIKAEDLLHHIWQDAYYNKNINTITVHIRRLREKLNDTAGQQKYIRTVWGIGYMISDET